MGWSWTFNLQNIPRFLFYDFFQTKFSIPIIKTFYVFYAYLTMTQGLQARTSCSGLSKPFGKDAGKCRRSSGKNAAVLSVSILLPGCSARCRDAWRQIMKVRKLKSFCRCHYFKQKEWPLCGKVERQPKYQYCTCSVCMYISAKEARGGGFKLYSTVQLTES